MGEGEGVEGRTKEKRVGIESRGGSRVGGWEGGGEGRRWRA